MENLNSLNGTSNAPKSQINGSMAAQTLKKKKKVTTNDMMIVFTSKYILLEMSRFPKVIATDRNYNNQQKTLKNQPVPFQTAIMSQKIFRHIVQLCSITATCFEDETSTFWWWTSKNRYPKATNAFYGKCPKWQPTCRLRWCWKGREFCASEQTLLSVDHQDHRNIPS